MPTLQFLQMMFAARRRAAMKLFVFCIMALAAASVQAAQATGIYRLDVAFDLAHSRLMGTADILPARPGRLEVDLGELRILSVEADGHSVALPANTDAPLAVSVRRRLRIHYQADYPEAGGEQVSSAGIVLGGDWYPGVRGRYRYRLRAVLPEGWQAVSEADAVRREAVPDGVRHEFVFRHPLPHQDGISLAASDRYVVSHRKYRDIDLYTYLLPEDARHAGRFLDKAAEYLARFERRLGPYPYRRFSIVEHVPAGAHSLPTYIVLGRDHIRAEAWEDTSLDHEIAHQWLGNTVFTDYGSGNWNEGLTLYVADYLSSEAAGRGWECRRRMLAGYGNNIPADKATPLAEFLDKDDDRAAKFIGYGKSAMVFHMLRRDLGDARFFAGLRRFVAEHRFGVASWHDIRKSFEAAAGRPLDWFFAQWVWRAETPNLDIASIEARKVSGGGIDVELVITQGAQGEGRSAFRLRLPLVWRFADGRSLRETVAVSGERTVIRRSFADTPVEIALDEEFDVFRTLHQTEFPPTIERLLTRERILYVTDKAVPSYYQPVMERLAQLDRRVMAMSIEDTRPRSSRSMRARPFVDGGSARRWQAVNALEADSPAASGMRADSVLVLDRANAVLTRLIPAPPPAAGDFEVTVAPHPRDARRLVGLIHAESEAAVTAALETMPNLWCFSRVVLKEGRVVERSVADTPRGVRKNIAWQSQDDRSRDLRQVQGRPGRSARGNGNLRRGDAHVP
jgi:aminopeptidase N